MADVKRIVMAGGTLACIGAIGFIVQSGSDPVPVASAGVVSAAPGVNGMQTPVEIGDISLTAADTGLLPEPAAPQAVSPSLPQVPQPLAAQPGVEAQTEVSLLGTPAESPGATLAPRNEPEIAAHCEITMTGTELPGALVALDLQAPCMPNERLTMHHNGMMFTETTDAAGALSIVVPALSPNAVFIASFANSEGAVASTKVGSLELYDRAVAQTEFSSSARLHALEYGADYDQDGHVWTDAAGDIETAALGESGFMISLGNPAVGNGTMAQVYTFPSGLAKKSGDVELSVEIEVTNMNCGHEIEAQTLQVLAGAQPKVQTLDLTMPDCDAVGDFLVLKNMLNDLKVAANAQ